MSFLFKRVNFAQTEAPSEGAVLIQPIDYYLLAWFALAACSTVYVAIDQFRNNPEPAVMRWGFILMTLYMGPFGLLLYKVTRAQTALNKRPSV